MTRLAGLALFLPVPVVLVLFTQAPFGIAASLALGVALMVTHRLYARPFALARAGRRCLWCGGAAGNGPTLVIEEPLGTTRWAACAERHADRARRFLAWATDHASFARAGILGTLGLFLVAAILVAAKRAGRLEYADAVNAFRLGIALTVLPLAVLGPRRPAAAEAALRPPFPVHMQALIGTAAVVWLFRLVGLAWLGLALAHFATRA